MRRRRLHQRRRRPALPSRTPAARHKWVLAHGQPSAEVVVAVEEEEGEKDQERKRSIRCCCFGPARVLVGGIGRGSLMLGSMDLLLRWCNRWRLQFWKGREAAPPVRAVGVVRPDSRRRWGQPAVHVHALATGAGGPGHAGWRHGAAPDDGGRRGELRGVRRGRRRGGDDGAVRAAADAARAGQGDAGISGARELEGTTRRTTSSTSESN